MALQILPAPPSVGQGYADLGNVLLQGARDYATEKRTSDREAELRHQQLADIAAQRAYNDQQIQSQRAYSDKRFDTESARRLQDQLTLADASQARQDIQRLIDSGLITLEDSKDPTKLQAASLKGIQLGVLAKESPLIASGLLNASDANDPDAVARAMNQQGQLNLDTVRQKTDAVANAGSRISQTESDKKQLQQRISDIDQSLGSPTPQPTEQQINALAKQKAQSDLDKDSRPWFGRKPPTPQQIAAKYNDAKAELTQLAKDNDFQRKQNAAIQEKLLEDQLRDKQSEQSELIKTYPNALQVAPAAATPVSPVTPIQAAPTPSIPTPQARANALAIAGGNAPPAANMVGMQIPTELQSIPTANLTPSELAAVQPENDRRAAAAKALLIDTPIQQAQAKIDALNKQSSDVLSQNQNAPTVYYPGLMGAGSALLSPAQGSQASQLSSIANQRAAAQKTLTDLKARMQVAPLPATQPMVLNAATNAPVLPDPVQDDNGPMGFNRVAPWNVNQFNVQPANSY